MHAESRDTDLPIQFTENSQQTVSSKEGTVTLSWQWLDESVDRTGWLVELEQSTDKDFKSSQLRYRGTDSATFISGLPAGEFFYRLRAVNPAGQATAWTPQPKTVEVQYVSKNLVLVLMIIGAIVFVATSLTIGLGHWRSAQSSA